MSDGFSTPEAGRPAEQEVVETVRRIMGENTSDPASPAENRAAAVQYAEPPQYPGNGTSARPTTASGLVAGTSNGQSNGSRSNDSQQTTEVAKEQAADVADSAKQAGTQVAQTVKEQAADVTNEAGRQAKQLLAEAQSELGEQAAQQQQKVAGGLHALADELDGMVRGSEQDGVATDLARQAAEKARQIEIWLEDRDPGSLLDEVRDFGRRRPGTYLAIAAGAGILAGRLARGLSASSDIPTQRTGGYPNAAGQGVPAPTGLPAEGDDFTDPPVQVAPGPVPGLGATNVVGGPVVGGPVVGGPRGDLSR